MLVSKNLSIEIPGTNTHYFNLERYQEASEDNVLFYGYNQLFSDKEYNDYRHVRNKIYFNVTMPTEFCSDQNIYLDDKFDKIYTICPFSVHWLNIIKKTNKYKLAFYPFNENDIPEKSEKIWDVCYHGGLHGKPGFDNKYLNMLLIMSKFRYRYVTMTHGINELTYIGGKKFATNVDLTNSEKLKLISQCKISICFNNFPVLDEHIDNILNQPRATSNLAFSQVLFNQHNAHIPQFKSRFNEAAMCRTLNLIEEDDWNLANFWYKDDCYVTFTMGTLEEKIKHILENYDDYQDMIERAYQQSLKYTTQNLYNMIKEDNK